MFSRQCSKVTFFTRTSHFTEVYAAKACKPTKVINLNIHYDIYMTNQSTKGKIILI